jgi:hypothetical protein
MQYTMIAPQNTNNTAATHPVVDERPLLLSVFSGSGGLDLGFQQEAFTSGYSTKRIQRALLLRASLRLLHSTWFWGRSLRLHSEHIYVWIFTAL